MISFAEEMRKKRSLVERKQNNMKRMKLLDNNRNKESSPIYYNVYFEKINKERTKINRTKMLTKF